LSRHTLLAALLLLAIPCSLAAAPKERSEAVVPDAEEPRLAPADSGAVPDPYLAEKVPPIEGAGGPHVGHHVGPHQGALVPIGESLRHLEFLLDSQTGMVTMYVLDGEAKEPATLQQDLIVLNVQTGEAAFPMALFGDRDAEGSMEKPRGVAKFAGGIVRLQGVTRFHAEMDGVKVGHQLFRHIPFAYPEGTEPVER